MKKILLLCILNLLVFTSCMGRFDSTVEVAHIMNMIKSDLKWENAVDEDVKSIENAERYGLVLENIEEGRLYYSKNTENPDKVIIIKAKDEKAIEGIEKAFNAEVVGLSDAWKNNSKEVKKVDSHVSKTRGKYVTLIVAEDAKRIEKLFDSMIVMR